MRGEWTPHPEGLDHADQLVALISHLGDFTIGVAAFPDNSGFEAMVVSSDQVTVVMLIILGIGAVVGMIGSGIAASRFLDV